MASISKSIAQARRTLIDNLGRRGPNLTFAEACNQNADEIGDRPALIDRRHRFTWSAVKSVSDRLAQTLLERDIMRPDIVMIHLPNSAEQFLIRMLPDDRGRVGAFNDKIQVEPAEFTGDRDLLIDSLKVLDFGNPTRLYDGVIAGLDTLVGVTGRRVVLVFTDGDDTSSDANSGDVLDRAVAEEVMIYSIGLEADYFNGIRRVRTRPDRNLRRFAEETGGGYFELEETSDLGPTFTRVAQELHSQYVLGFTPQVRDGKVHELEVRLKRRGMRARARRSYVAPADPEAAGRARR